MALVSSFAWISLLQHLSSRHPSFFPIIHHSLSLSPPLFFCPIIHHTLALSFLDWSMRRARWQMALFSSFAWISLTSPTQALTTPLFTYHSSLALNSFWHTCVLMEGQCCEITLTLIFFGYFCKYEAFDLPMQLCLIP